MINDKIALALHGDHNQKDHGIRYGENAEKADRDAEEAKQFLKKLEGMTPQEIHEKYSPRSRRMASVSKRRVMDNVRKDIARFEKFAKMQRGFAEKEAKVGLSKQEESDFLKFLLDK